MKAPNKKDSIAAITAVLKRIDPATTVAEMKQVWQHHCVAGPVRVIAFEGETWVCWFNAGAVAVKEIDN